LAVKKCAFADRSETLDEIQGPENQQQHTREHDPAVAALVVSGVAALGSVTVMGDWRLGI
jgi:hypothetical protein